MPVAASSQKEPQVSGRFRHLIPKPPGFSPSHGHGQIAPSEGQGFVAELGQYSNSLQAGVAGDSPTHYFNTHSPPILNLSPNLSPTDTSSLRNSPVYDLRESTRRRSLQDLQSSLNQQMSHSPQYYSGIIEESDSKSESPTRKRRKMNHGVTIDLTHSPSPPPPREAYPWNSVRPQPRTRRTTNEILREQLQQQDMYERRRVRRTQEGEQHRRSPPTSRRRTRERHVGRHESPERRAFQPPPHLPPRHHPVLPHQSQQPPVVFDMEQVRVPVSNPASLPYGVPVCTTPHYMPMCTGGHVNMCTTQSTWSLPGCNMGIPSCSIQHIPACGLQQFPVAPPGIPPTMLHSHTTQHPPHPNPHAHQHPHHQGNPHQAHHPSHHAQHPITPATQFVHGAPQVQHEEEVQIIAEHRPPLHPVPPTLPHGHGASMNPSPPVLLQEPSVHPTPHDVYSPFSRYRRASTVSGRRWRAIPPPPPPYPGFLLHFLAMLGNPPMHPFGVDINDEATEVENYEALLNLAERLGEAKPKGLLKAEIDQLPSYRFNSDINRSSMEQTSCVVCMCDFESRQLLRVLPCSHEFHTKCVDKWLKTNRTCPICRADASDSVSQSE